MRASRSLVVLGLLAACASAPPAPPPAATAPPAPSAASAPAPAAADVAYLAGVALAEGGAREPGPVKVFRNAAGQPACPVMGNAIAKAEEAISYTDYHGTRYYFCCDSCEKRFLEDPVAYADGKYLDAHGLDPTAQCEEEKAT